MSDLPTAQQLVAWALGVRAEEGAADGLTADDLTGGQELSDHEVAQLWLSMQHYQRAATAALKALADELANRVQANGAFEVAGEWISYKPRRTTRIDDTEGFWQWVRDNPDYVPALFNPNSARKTGVPPAVFDTFFKVEEGADPVLTSVPLEILEAKKGTKHD